MKNTVCIGVAPFIAVLWGVAIFFTACQQATDPDPEPSPPPPAFVPVTGITGVPSGGAIGTVIDLSSTGVEPADAANKTIIWTSTDVTIANARFTTPQTGGEITITGTVANGKAQGEPFIKAFTLTITETLIPVTGITGVPGAGVAGTPINVSGAAVVPADATNKTIVWSIASDSEVSGEISGASVTPAAAGTLKLVGTVAQGTTPYTQTFTITVSAQTTVTPPANLTGIRIKTEPNTILYARGQRFDPAGLVVEGTYKDGAVKDLGPTEYTLSEVNTESPGIKWVTVTAGAFTARFAITVDSAERILQSIRVTPPNKTTYEFGEALDFTGMIVTAVYTDGTTENQAAYSYAGYDRALRGTQTVTVTVNKKTDTFDVTLRIPASATVSANPFSGSSFTSQSGFYRQVYYRGEQVGKAPEKLKVMVTGNGITAALTPEQGLEPYTITGFSTAQIGTQYPKLTLDDKTIDLEIYVADVAPEVYFDYGYRRTADAPNGAGPGMKYYTVPLNRSLVITPTLYLMGTNPSYTWDVVSNAGTYTSAPSGKFFRISPQAEGTYRVRVTVSGGGVTRTAETEILCTPALPGTPPAPPFSAITPIKHFAPGQFTASGNGYGWSLGAQGGYEIWQVRKTGAEKITITGNPMNSWSEPGVVWVSIDENGNGLPDDTWYELKGSEDATNPALITREYSLRYIRSADTETLNEYGQYRGRIYWVDGKGRTGILSGAWPATAVVGAVNGPWATFTGTLLRDNGDIDSGTYNSGIITAFSGSGYVDAYCADQFAVSDAIQRDGTPADLPWIDFVKVQTGVFHYGGSFGEVSTEIRSADGLGSQTDFPNP